MFIFPWGNFLLQHDFYLVFYLFDQYSGGTTGLPNSTLFLCTIHFFSQLLIFPIFIFTFFISLWWLGTNFYLIWSSATATAATLRQVLGQQLWSSWANPQKKITTVRKHGCVKTWSVEIAENLECKQWWQNPLNIPCRIQLRSLDPV